MATMVLVAESSIVFFKSQLKLMPPFLIPLEQWHIFFRFLKIKGSIWPNILWKGQFQIVCSQYCYGPQMSWLISTRMSVWGWKLVKIIQFILSLRCSIENSRWSLYAVLKHAAAVQDNSFWTLAECSAWLILLLIKQPRVLFSLFSCEWGKTGCLRA